MIVVVEPENPGARVGVPFGPITVGEVVAVAGKPFAPTGVDAESARLKSVLESTRGRPSGPTVTRFGLMTLAPATPVFIPPYTPFGTPPAPYPTVPLPA